MIVYLDTSALVPLMVEEHGSDVAGRLWDGADRIASSRLLVPEGRAALAQAGRMGRLTAAQLRTANEDLTDLLDQVDFVEVTAAIADRAGDLAATHGLRGYDAVHLASAEAVAGPDLVVITGDRSLLAAAGALGLDTASTSAGTAGPST